MCCRIATTDGRGLKPGTSKTNNGVEGNLRDNNTNCIDSDTTYFKYDWEVERYCTSKSCIISPADVIDALQEAIQDVNNEVWSDCSTQTYT